MACSICAGLALCCQTPAPWRVQPTLVVMTRSFGIRVERLGDQLFGDIGAVGVGGVNKVDAELDGAAQGGEGGGGVSGGPQIPLPVMRMAP